MGDRKSGARLTTAVHDTLGADGSAKGRLYGRPSSPAGVGKRKHAPFLYSQWEFFALRARPLVRHLLSA